MTQTLRTLFLTLWLGLPAQAAELVMIDQTGCYYCELWTQEIGDIYPKTAEGAFAPLRRINIRNIPEDLELASYPAYTPTFILVENNRELARLEGYPGEDFFWPMISQMFEQHPDYIDPNL